MLPVQGLFRQLPCPYYVSGLCERPHCLFRHTKADLVLAQKSEVDLANDVPVDAEDGNKGERCNGQETERDDDAVPSQKDLSENKSHVSTKRKLEHSGEVASKRSRITDDYKDCSSNKSSHKDSSIKSSSSSEKHRHGSSTKHRSSSKSSSHNSSRKSHKHKNHKSSKHESKRSRKTHSSSTSSDTSKSSKESKSVKRNSDAGNDPSETVRSSGNAGSVESEDSYSFSQSIFNYSFNDISEDPSPVHDYNVGDDDVDEIEAECMKIFQEYSCDNSNNLSDKKSATSEVSASRDLKEGSEYSHQAVAPKRIAHSHAGKREAVVPGLSMAKKPPTSHELSKLVALRIEEQRKKSEKSSEAVSTTTGSSCSPKKRIAHVPNVNNFLRNTKKMESRNQTTSSTTSQAFSKSRINFPDKKNGLDSNNSNNTKSKGTPPSIVKDSSVPVSKHIPLQIRQAILEKLYTAFISAGLSNTEAFSRSLKEEHQILNRTKSQAVYRSVAVNIITNAKSMIGAEQPENDSRSLNPEISACRKKLQKLLERFVSRRQLYQDLKTAVLTEEQLIENGYPRESSCGIPGTAVAKKTYEQFPYYIHTESKRTCARCNKVYAVSPNGSQIARDECSFHRGKVQRQRGVPVYQCCGGSKLEVGCTVMEFHVPRANPIECAKGFVSAVKEEGTEELMGDDPWDIVAFDAEMVFTVGGPKLARATFISVDGSVLLDEIIRLEDEVLDYCTEFSGLDESSFLNAKTTFLQLQAIVLSKIKPNTIIIGHSLENDLLYLFLKHNYVIDTAVLYPHPRGFKYALRTLCQNELQLIIQNSVTGHDSEEDALAALCLVLHKCLRKVR